MRSPKNNSTGNMMPREPHGLCGENIFSDRVMRLRRDVQEAEPSVCIERAAAATGYFKNPENRHKPIVVQKAEALSHILKFRTASIYPDELLVGCFTSKRVGGSLLPELHHVSIAEDLIGISRREVNPLRISNHDRLSLIAEILPFWSTRFLVLKAFPFPRNIRFIVDSLKGEKYLINEGGGISHLVPDYSKLVRLGTSGIAAEAEKLGAACADESRKYFYSAVAIACDALGKLSEPYARIAREKALREKDDARRREILEIAEACERVPRLPARTMHEALQAMVFAQIALNLESLDNSICPGRLDQVLFPYYQADIEAGRIDESRARELIGCFTVKMCEIVPIFSGRITKYHGGIFNGQVVVAGGVDREGRDGTNDLTWMFLDAMDRLRMRQPNYHARIHAGSPDEYVRRISEMLRNGSGAPSVMNDDVVIPMLRSRGADPCDARDYSPVGCVEPSVCGASFGSTDAALMNLALCLERALGLKKGGARAIPATECNEIGQVIDLFKTQVDFLVDDLIKNLSAIERANARFHPTPMTSMLMRGCLEKGIDSTAGGAAYNSSGIQGIGIADIADSLSAMDDVVFRRRYCGMRTLIAALRSNFDGMEILRARLLKAPKYGNDDPSADRYASMVMKIFSDSLARYTNTRGGPYLAGFYSVTAHQAFGEKTGALPSGRLSGRSLANGLSPANGADRSGPTAVLNSASGLELGKYARNGMNLNLKFDRKSLEGEKGAKVIGELIRGYFRSGGMQLQVNVLDPSVLKEEYDHPGSHPWLLVRVSGYSAYFNDLSPEIKLEIINRTMHKI